MMLRVIYFITLILAALLVQVEPQVQGQLRPFSTDHSVQLEALSQETTTITSTTFPHGRKLQTTESDSTFKWILERAGPMLFIGLQCSSVNTAWTILRRHSVGKLSAIPFASLLVNCILWTLYGHIKKNGSVFYPNLLGVFVGTFCMSIYHDFAAQKPWDQYLVVALISILCLGLAQYGQVQAIGVIGCVLSIAVSGSPLAVVRTVLRDRSTAALPFATSLATWLNNLSWILFGYFIADDPLIYLPNLLGFSLSSMQLALFAVYGFPTTGTVVSNKKIAVIADPIEEA